MVETKQVTVSDPETALAELYTGSFPAVAHYISKKGGSFEDARDVFHDALLIFLEKKLQSGFVPEQSEKAYVFGIAKNLWHQKFRMENRRLPNTLPGETLPQDNILREPAVSRINRVLFSAGKKCMELLSEFYYNKTGIRGVAEKFGFSSERSATVQKYKCLEKVRSYVKQNSLAYEDFLD